MVPKTSDSKQDSWQRNDDWLVKVLGHSPAFDGGARLYLHGLGATYR